MKEPQLSLKERRVGVATAFHGQKGNALANFGCHTRPYWGHCATRGHIGDIVSHEAVLGTLCNGFVGKGVGWD